MRKQLLKSLIALAMLLGITGAGLTAHAQTTVTIGSGTSTSTYYPIYSCYGYNYSQQIYLGSEITGAGWSGGGQISKIRFFLSYSPGSPAQWNNWTVYLGNTTQSNFSSSSNWIPVSGMTSVFSGIIPTTAGTWVELTLTTPFVYTGGNLVVAVDENSPSWSCTAEWGSYTSTSGNRAMLYYSDGTNPDPASPPNANMGPSSSLPRFQFDIISLTPCSGIPTAGITSAPDSVCPGVAFSATATGSTSASGITYQWQSSPDGTSWTDIPGATSSSYGTTLTTTTWFRRAMQCTSTPGMVYSTPKKVVVKSFLLCYCVSAATYTSDEDIYHVSIGTMDNSSTCSTPGISAMGPGSILNQYSNFKSGSAAPAAPALARGTSVPFSVTVNTCGSYPYSSGLAIFIDFNQNGLFTDPGEKVYSSPGTTTLPYTTSGLAAIPATAALGTTAMRVIAVESLSGGSIDPCATYGWGETEDYLVNIVVPVPCSGTPAAPTFTASKDSVCEGEAFTLTATAPPGVVDLNYQFQKSEDGGVTWANIGTASATYVYSIPSQTVTTLYRVIVTCTNPGGGTVTSAADTVLQKSFMNCYCASVSTYPYDEEIYLVEFGTMSNASTCTTPAVSAMGPGSVLNSYSNFKSGSAAPAPPVVVQGTDATYKVKVNTCGTYPYSSGLAIFIDYNQNGLFTDPGETVYASGTTTLLPYTDSGVITIPMTAATGLTAMRVIVSESSAGTSITPCGTYYYGETEDYLINIVPPCDSVMGVSVSGISLSGATLNWTEPTTGITPAAYQYEIRTSGAPGSGSAGLVTSGSVAAPTTSATVSGLSPATTYYAYVRTNCGGTSVGFWTMGVAFVTPPANDDAPGAFLLSVGAGCAPTMYTNVSATIGGGEPGAHCVASTTYRTVWFKFVAPPSGAVRVSTDYPGGTLLNSRVALFEAADVTDYSTFQILACDEDNGSNLNLASVLYATRLHPGTTYYVEVGGFNEITEGTFCVTVDELNAAMISPYSNCVPGTIPNATAGGYTGWTSLVDDESRLIVQVRSYTGAAPNHFSAAQYRNAGPIRSYTMGSEPAVAILDRNWLISTTSSADSNVSVQFFFTDAEYAALMAASPGASLGNINVIHQSGIVCQPDYNPSGSSELLGQTFSGTLVGAKFVEVQTPSFSNFYLRAGGSPVGVGQVIASGNGVEVIAYPNPVSSILTVEARGAVRDSRVVLTDLTGKVLEAHFISDGKVEFNMQSLAAGIYFIRYNDDHYSKTIKVTKQ